MSDHSPTPAPQPTVGPTSMGDVIQGVRREIRAAPQEGTTPPDTEWICLATRRHFTGPFRCETSNAADATTCVACGSDRPASVSSSRTTTDEIEAIEAEFSEWKRVRTDDAFGYEIHPDRLSWLIAELRRSRASLASQTDSSLRAAHVCSKSGLPMGMWVIGPCPGCDAEYSPAASSPTVTPPQTPPDTRFDRYQPIDRWPLKYVDLEDRFNSLRGPMSMCMSGPDGIALERLAKEIAAAAVRAARSTPTEEKTNG